MALLIKMSSSTVHVLKRIQILNNKITLIPKVLYYPCPKLNSNKPKKKKKCGE